MEVIVCDDCNITNVDNTKPFAVVSSALARINYATAERLKEDVITNVAITPYTPAMAHIPYKKLVLCNECTMKHVTEHIVRLFSTENMERFRELP